MIKANVLSWHKKLAQRFPFFTLLQTKSWTQSWKIKERQNAWLRMILLCMTTTTTNFRCWVRISEMSKAVSESANIVLVNQFMILKRQRKHVFLFTLSLKKYSFKTSVTFIGWKRFFGIYDFMIFFYLHENAQFFQREDYFYLSRAACEHQWFFTKFRFWIFCSHLQKLVVKESSNYSEACFFPL